MSNPNTGKRLHRLVDSGLCEACESVNVSEYSEELVRVAEKVASIDKIDKQSKFFKALADKTRLRILRLLGVREMCVCEVMVALSLTQPTASHHLGILENVGLVKDRKEGKWVFYRIVNPELFENMCKIAIQ
jgi:DNA-binding transcriptional ArsR family regulator